MKIIKMIICFVIDHKYYWSGRMKERGHVELVCHKCPSEKWIKNGEQYLGDKATLGCPSPICHPG